MKKNLNRHFRLFIFCIGCLFSGQLFAQGSISSNGGKVKITFDESTPGILNGSFTATGIASTPAVGELDSDGVNIDDDLPGTADLPAVFGTNDVRFFGTSPGNVSSSVDGIWAFDVLGGPGVNRTLGFQPGSNGWASKDYSDGQIVFKFINNSGVTLTAFRVQYDIFEANEGDRNSVIEAYLTTNVSSPAYGPVRATHTTAGAGNIAYSWSGAKPFDFSVTSGLSVPNGGAIYLRFYIYDGPATPGSFPWRDEFAIDNISIIGANNADLLDQCDLPVAHCKNPTVLLNSSGTATLAVSNVNNGSIADCGLTSITVSPSSFNCSNVGSNTVTLTVTDSKNHTGTCTATVTVADVTKPIASCKNVTVQLDAAGNGSISAGAVNKGSSDACGIAELWLNKTTFNCANVGPNTVTLTVTDYNSNINTCSATVTVVDHVKPTASCKNVTVQLDANGNGSTSAAAVNNGSGDACGIAQLALNKTTFNCSNIGANTVTLTVTDNNGNASTCSATVTVVDQVKPTASCQDVTVQLDAGGSGSTTASAVNNGSGDACGIQSLVLSRQSFSCADMGANTVTLTVTDNNGNASTCTATRTVEDNVDPVALCRDVTVQLDGSGNGSTAATAVDNGSSDACGIQSAVLSRQSFSCADVGANTVTLTVTDNNGNASTCTATVTVEDNVDPIALCQDVTVQLDDSGNGSTAATAVDNGSSDACGIQSAVLSRQSFSCADVGANTVTLTVTDNNGNASTCTAIVTVEDNVAPVALCRNVTVQLNAVGAGSTTANAVDNGSNDACGIQSTVLAKQSFSCADLGANTITLTVTDNNGNTSTCAATVSVEDRIDPVIDCNDLTVSFNSESSIALNPEGLAFATDNCSVSLTADQATVPCAAVGQVIPVTVTAVDPGGNTASCISYVTVTGLPCGWMSLPDGIGCTGGSEGSYDPATESFTLTSEGCNNTPSATSDQSGYLKYELCGDGSITAHLAGLTTPGFAGIVMRESEAPGAKKVGIAYNGSSALARYVRYTTGGMSYPSYIQAFGARWMRIVRTGNLFRGYYSVNGTNWIYAFAVSVAMEDCIQVGLMTWNIAPNQVVTAAFDHVVIDPPYGGGVAKGLVDTGAGVPVKPETDRPGMELWPNPASGLFNLSLDPAWGDGVTVSIEDSAGRLVAVRKADASVEGRLQFDLGNEPPGGYLVRVESEGGAVAIRRMVIVR